MEGTNLRVLQSEDLPFVHILPLPYLQCGKLIFPCSFSNDCPAAGTYLLRQGLTLDINTSHWQVLMLEMTVNMIQPDIILQTWNPKKQLMQYKVAYKLMHHKCRIYRVGSLEDLCRRVLIHLKKHGHVNKVRNDIFIEGEL